MTVYLILLSRSTFLFDVRRLNSWSWQNVTWLGYGASTGYPVIVVVVVEMVREEKAQAHDNPIEFMLKEAYVCTACIISPLNNKEITGLQKKIMIFV
jgi:hypothetical protein